MRQRGRLTSGERFHLHTRNPRSPYPSCGCGPFPGHRWPHGEFGGGRERPPLFAARCGHGGPAQLTFAQHPLGGRSRLKYPCGKVFLALCEAAVCNFRIKAPRPRRSQCGTTWMSGSRPTSNEPGSRTHPRFSVVSGRPATLHPAARMGALASRRGANAQVPGRGPKYIPLMGVRGSVATDRPHCGFLRVSIDRRLVGRVSPACVRFGSAGL